MIGGESSTLQSLIFISPKADLIFQLRCIAQAQLIQKLLLPSQVHPVPQRRHTECRSTENVTKQCHINTDQQGGSDADIKARQVKARTDFIKLKIMQMLLTEDPARRFTVKQCVEFLRNRHDWRRSDSTKSYFL